MMYVADSKITFNLQGIIYIAKVDKVSTKLLTREEILSGSPHKNSISYNLELQYKTVAKVIEYETEEARNAIYDLATEKLLAKRVSNGQ